MSEIMIIILLSVIFAVVVLGEVRFQMKFFRLCDRLESLCDFTDESVLQYTYYVVEQLKQNKKPESFSKWKASLS